MYFFGQLGILQYLLLWLAVFLGCYAFINRRRKKFNLPPGPRGLPILGILPFLGSKPHLKLSKLGEKYGGLFGVYMGFNYVVVVTDVALAKKLLNKSSTADRPPDMFGLLPDGVGFSGQSGSEWVEQRRFCLTELRNVGFGTSAFEQLVKIEVKDVLNILKESQGKPMDITNCLSTSISNNIVSLLTNHRLPMGHPSRTIINDGIEGFMRFFNQSTIAVHFPQLLKLLNKVGLLKGHRNLKAIINMNKCIRQEIEEVKKKDDVSFIGRYLEEMEKNQQQNLGNYYNEKGLVGNAQALFLAGSETTFTSMIWLLLAMASYPEVQRKVHEEIDEVLRDDDSIDWIDRGKLPYCMATIMEAQRWRTLAPLNLLHRTNEDMKINGYDIPNGTTLMTVLWAFHTDTKYWKDPDAFKPERFLSDDGKTTVEREAYLPFSYGKRMCIGKTVAYIELFNYFVSIMKKFQVLPASATSPPDLEGFLGLTFQPKKQELRYVLR